MLNAASFQRQTPCEHLVKGTGWGGLSVVTSLAIAVIAAGVLAVGATLLIWDLSFIYSWAVVNPLHLLWAIPVTVAFIALDVGITWWIGIHALKAIKGLAEFTKESGENAAAHFRALCFTPANSAS